MAILVLQCLGLDDNVDFLNRLALLAAGGVSPWALLYGIAPGEEWSVRVELHYKEPKVRDVLKRLARSPNADKRARSAIAAILSGAAAKYDRESGEKTVLKCPVDAGMPKTE